MKFEQFDNGIKKLELLLTTRLISINEKMALDATALIKDRLLNTGVNAKGNSFGEYSTNELPAFFFKDKSLNKSGEDFYLSATTKKKKDDKRKGISYKEWREANNRPTDHKTFSFSGTTLKDVGVRKEIVAGAKVITQVGAKNTKVRDNGDSTEKILDEYLAPEYGNILEPNASEIEIMKTILQKQVEAIIHESFR